MARFLREFALQQKVGFELIVSDGSSVDGSIALTKRLAGWTLLPGQGSGRGKGEA